MGSDFYQSQVTTLFILQYPSCGKVSTHQNAGYPEIWIIVCNGVTSRRVGGGNQSPT